MSGFLFITDRQPSSERWATSKRLRAAVVSILCAAGFVGCASRYEGPAVCGIDERETLLKAQLSTWSPSEAFEITAASSVFVAVVSDPRAEPGRLWYAGGVNLLEDGAEPELTPDPNFPESRISLDPEIRFANLDEYRIIEAEPGFYRLYSGGVPTIAVVRCP